MPKITKLNGSFEHFDIKKLERSIMNVGVSRQVASDIAQGIPVKTGLTTKDIRKRVTVQLRKKAPRFAERYALTLRMDAVESSEVKSGTVAISQRTLTRMQAEEGDTVTIILGSKRHEFEIRYRNITPGEIWLNKEDVERMGVGTNMRITTEYER